MNGAIFCGIVSQLLLWNSASANGYLISLTVGQYVHQAKERSKEEEENSNAVNWCGGHRWSA